MKHKSNLTEKLIGPPIEEDFWDSAKKVFDVAMWAAKITMAGYALFSAINGAHVRFTKKDGDLFRNEGKDFDPNRATRVSPGDMQREVRGMRFMGDGVMESVDEA